MNHTYLLPFHLLEFQVQFQLLNQYLSQARHQLQHLRLHRLQRRPVSIFLFFRWRRLKFRRKVGRSYDFRLPSFLSRLSRLSLFPSFSSSRLAASSFLKHKTPPVLEKQPVANSPTASRASPWQRSSPKRSPPSRRRATRSCWAPTSRGGRPRTFPSRRAGSRRG